MDRAIPASRAGDDQGDQPRTSVQASSDRAETPSDRGSSPLRLVRLRVALTLISMAILPLALAAPLASVILDGQRAAERAAVARDTDAVAGAIREDLELASESIVLLASNPALGAAFESSAKPVIRQAQTSLRALTARSDRPIVGASLIDRTGLVKVLVSGDTVLSVPTRPIPASDPVLRATIALPTGGVFRAPIRTGPDASPTMVFATPIAASEDDIGSPGILRVEISIPRLIELAGAALGGRSGTIQLVASADGNVLIGRSQPESEGQPETVGATAAIPQAPEWSVRVSEPQATQATAQRLVAFLGLMVVFLGILVVWMARQILRPAEALETSRAQMTTLYEQAKLDALRDTLTGLGNHRAFQEELDRQVDQSRRYTVPLALLLIDVDDLKLVNDAEGHGAGDEVLAAFGRLIRGMIRTADRAFRTGGDEFAILMPHTDANGAEVVARRLLAGALEGRPDRRAFSFSAGISGSGELGTDRRQIFAQAEAALSWSKGHGRTSITIFDPASHRRPGMLPVGSDLSASVANVAAARALRPVYQPIVDVRSGAIVGYEALVRPAPDSGFSNPGELFTAAEVAGRTVELDRACLDVVTAGAVGLRADLLLTVNLSPRTLEAPEFTANALVELFRRSGLVPEQVVLELTEREGVEQVDRLRRSVAACRAVGFHIAADDVGAGNAGLRLLSQIQFDIVKIDLSLVQRGAEHDAALAVMTSIQQLAQRWGAGVIAEGIETPEQLELVRGLGIGAGQGYLLGRPGESLDLATVDLDGLLTRDDWLRKLARPRPTSLVGASRSA